MGGGITMGLGLISASLSKCLAISHADFSNMLVYPRTHCIILSAIMYIFFGCPVTLIFLQFWSNFDGVFARG